LAVEEENPVVDTFVVVVDAASLLPELWSLPPIDVVASLGALVAVPVAIGVALLAEPVASFVVLARVDTRVPAVVVVGTRRRSMLLGLKAFEGLIESPELRTLWTMR
jgi:hypothetical protein